MANEAREDMQLPQFLLTVVEKILPRGIREEYVVRLQELCLPVGDWLSQSLLTIAAGYRKQAILAFNKVAFGLQLAGICYCFSAASLPLPLGVILGATLASLIFRSAFTYPADSYGKQRSPGSSWQYSVDSMGDAVIAMVVVLLSESLTLTISPGLAVPPNLLFRGALLAMPVLATLRMVFRPKVDWRMPFHGSNLTSEQIFKKTWWLNILWICALIGTIIANPDSLPDWVPEHDFMRTFIPLQIFINWFRIQQNPFFRRDHIETLFGNWRKKKKARQRELLIKGLSQREPFYRAYVALQGVLFLYLSIPLATTLWPWLAGRETDVDRFRIVLNLVTLATLAWTWNYLKDANRAAADAMQQDIDSPDFDPPLPMTS